jgi:CNT family concentrative nucleoside transporter
MTGLLGIAFLLGMAFLFSSARKSINWRTVGGAFAIQALLGAFILYSEGGISFLNNLTVYVANIISYSEDGIRFLFGGLLGNESLGFIFAINVLPVIIFFSSLIAVLYHLGIMSVVIRIIGGILQKLLGTSRPESMSAAANIFVGQTEAPLIIKPFYPR